MAATLHDNIVDAHTRPGAIPLAMITMRKSIYGFPFLSYTSMGLHYQKENWLTAISHDISDMFQVKQ